MEGRLKVEFFESHAHYDDEKFNEDREEIIEKIYSEDITKFISAGYSRESSKKGIELAEKYDYIYTTSGISPNDVKESIEETQKEIDELRKLIIEYKRGKKEKDKLVGIGEIGLDYYWNKENKEIQKYACNLDDASTGRIKELLLKSSVKKRVEQGIKKNRLDCTAEDIRKLFLIASERYDRPLNQVGIDLFSCNAAINLVNRKMIYCFPWLSQKHFPYCKVKIEKICRVLSDYGKLVLLPVSNQVNGLEKYNIIEFPRPLE